MLQTVFKQYYNLIFKNSERDAITIHNLRHNAKCLLRAKSLRVAMLIYHTTAIESNKICKRNKQLNAGNSHVVVEPSRATGAVLRSKGEGTLTPHLSIKTSDV